MIPIRIEDGADARLSAYAGVRDPRGLRDRGLLIAEGRFVIGRLLASGRLKVESLLLNDAALRGLRDEIAHADPSLHVYVASADVIAAATGFDMHRGYLAVADRPAPLVLDAVLPASSLVVVLEQVVDTDNVGAVFRNAEAFGVDLILLSPGSGDPFYRKAIRTSSGATMVVPFVAPAPWPDALDRLRAAGFVIVAMTPSADAVEIGEFIATKASHGRVAVLLGTEGHGLTTAAIERADICVRIPMSGTLDSLNIATAAGITLHRLHDVRRGPFPRAISRG